MIFEPATAFLRHIRLGDHEVVRGIYAAVRDENWGTVPPTLSNLTSEIGSESFRLRFEVTCREREIDFFWQGLISGETSGQVSYSFDGEARSRFRRNRIGICVLHPILECSGRPCVIQHPDGTRERGVFPRSISPHQPFMDIQGLCYEISATGASVEIQFAGDVFEMEDQRNWSDASFKTYCTPQRLPKPATVESGTKVQQSVSLSLKGLVRPVPPVFQGQHPQVSISTTPVVTLPPIGYCVASHGKALSGLEIQRLKLLRPAHLRVDLRLSSPPYPAALEQASVEASQLNTGLHIALTLSDQAEQELRELEKQLRRIQPKVLLWLVFHEAEQTTSEKWVRLAQSILQNYAPNVPLAGGTREFFTELNRNRPAADTPYLSCYSTNPQVHLLDNLTMVENLAGQASAAETAKDFSSRPVVVSPITLRIRSSLPHRRREDQGEGSSLHAELPPDVDPRQMSLFAAGWTLGSIARLAATANVHSLTYFETTGWRGLMEVEARPPLPEKFPSPPGSVFPVYHLLADLGEFSGKQIYPTHSSHPLLVEALTLFEAPAHRRILIANLTTHIQEVRIATGDCRGRVRYLDETNAEEAMRNPERFRAQGGAAVESISGKIELRLLPCSLGRIDLG